MTVKDIPTGKVFEVEIKLSESCMLICSYIKDKEKRGKKVKCILRNIKLMVGLLVIKDQLIVNDGGLWMEEDMPIWREMR